LRYKQFALNILFAIVAPHWVYKNVVIHLSNSIWQRRAWYFTKPHKVYSRWHQGFDDISPCLN